MQTLYVREKEKKSITRSLGQHILTQTKLPIPLSPPTPPPTSHLQGQLLAGHIVSTKPKTNKLNKEKKLKNAKFSLKLGLQKL